MIAPAGTLPPAKPLQVLTFTRRPYFRVSRPRFQREARTSPMLTSTTNGTNGASQVGPFDTNTSANMCRSREPIRTFGRRLCSNLPGDGCHKLPTAQVGGHAWSAEASVWFHQAAADGSRPCGVQCGELVRKVPLVRSGRRVTPVASKLAPRAMLITVCTTPAPRARRTTQRARRNAPTTILAVAYFLRVLAFT